VDQSRQQQEWLTIEVRDIRVPVPNNAEDATRVLSFIYAARAAYQVEKDLAEKQLFRAKQVLERAEEKLRKANEIIGRARCHIRAKGLPVIFAPSVQPGEPDGEEVYPDDDDESIDEDGEDMEEDY
jgi:hypothetical protein